MASIALVPRQTLYEHVVEVSSICDMVEALDNAGELTGEASDQLKAQLITAIAGTRAKVDACAAALATFEHAAISARLESERLVKRQQYFERAHERLADYVLAVLEASKLEKLEKLEGNSSTLAGRLNPASVVIDDDAKVTHEFLFYPEAPPPRPDKAAIKKALQAKRAVPGCRLERRKRLVRS